MKLTCKSCKWADKHKYKFISNLCCNPAWNIKDKSIYFLSVLMLTDCPRWESEKSKLLGVDYATKDGDYTCKVYGRYNKNGEVIIDKVVQFKDELWHYKRTCNFCGHIWGGLHCPHDGYQNPCPVCGKRPTVVGTDDVCDCEFDYPY